MARPRPVSRVLAAAVHELAQPCASAVLATDAALAVATRRDLPEVVGRLTATADALATLQARLRLIGLVAAAGGASRRGPTDVAAVVAAVLPGAAPGPPVLADVDPEVARLALGEIARAIDAAAERTEIRQAGPTGHIEVILRGTNAQARAPDLWAELLWLVGIDATFRSADVGVTGTLTLPPAGRRG